MTRITRRLNVRYAYPGKLGPDVVQAPAGVVFLIDGEGRYLTDNTGAYIVVEET